MKKFTLILVTLIFVIVLAPYFIGSSAETEIRQQVIKINTHPAYQVSLVNYEKGWFNSKAEFQMSILMPEEIIKSVPINNINIIQEIQHGPILWQGTGLSIGLMDSEIGFEIPQATFEDQENIEKLNKKVLSITSRTAFDLTTSIHFELTAFSMKEDIGNLNVKQGLGYLNFNKSGHIESSINWQGLTGNTGDTETIQIGTVSIDTKQDLISGEFFSPSAIFSGYFTVKISSVKLNDNTKGNMSLEDLHLKLTSDIKDNLANVAFVIATKNLFAIGQEFSDLTYDMSFDNLDVESLQRINQISKDSQGQSPMQTVAKMQGALPQLLEKWPVLKINRLNVTTKDGEINSDLTINIDHIIYDTKNPMTMMLALVANAKGQGPEVFFTELAGAEAIESLVQKNLITREQQNLKFEFTFNNGQALLNGHPIPLGRM